MSLAPLPSEARRVVYLGTPAIAVPPLRALCAAGFEIAAVITGPPRRRGRGAAPTPTPVAEFAAGAGMPVHHDLGVLDDLEVDLGVVVAFGTILPASLLARLPMVNLHFSLLPRWRGAAPVERAILAGDDHTGVCVMAVEEGLDTGGVLGSVTVALTGDETAASLAAHLASVGAALLVDTLTGVLPLPTPQQGEPVYAAKIGPSDLELVWNLPAALLERRVRVGGAWTTARGTRLRVTAARVSTGGDLEPGQLHCDGGVWVGTGAGTLELLEVIPAGRARQAALEWARGFRPNGKERLGAGP